MSDVFAWVWCMEEEEEGEGKGEEGLVVVEGETPEAAGLEEEEEEGGGGSLSSRASDAEGGEGGRKGGREGGREGRGGDQRLESMRVEKEQPSLPSFPPSLPPSLPPYLCYPSSLQAAAASLQASRCHPCSPILLECREWEPC